MFNRFSWDDDERDGWMGDASKSRFPGLSIVHRWRDMSRIGGEDKADEDTHSLGDSKPHFSTGHSQQDSSAPVNTLPKGKGCSMGSGTLCTRS